MLEFVGLLLLSLVLLLQSGGVASSDGPRHVEARAQHVVTPV